MTATVWMFSGLGSQYFDMGRSLFEADAGFRRHLLRCDEIAQMTFGSGFIDRLFAPDDGRRVALHDTRFAKSALFSMQYALGRSLMDRGARPARLLGYSLGEFVALCLAGAITPERAMGLLAYLASLLELRLVPGAGGMTAVLASPDLFTTDAALFDGCECACVNAPQNFVVAGAQDALDRCEGALRPRGILFQRQPVEYAYHASPLDALQADFRAAPGLRFAAPRMPVSLCSQTVIDGAPDIATLWSAVRRPVMFGPVAAALAADPVHVFLDLVPSGTLAANLRAVAGAARVATVLSPFTKNPVDLDAIVARHHGAVASKLQPDLQNAET